MKIDDYLSQVTEIVNSCKGGAMNADACHAQLEELNEEQIGEGGPVMKTSLQDFLDLENSDITLVFETEDFE